MDRFVSLALFVAAVDEGNLSGKPEMAARPWRSTANCCVPMSR
jgi:hypothetical protein